MCGCWTEALSIADRAAVVIPENLDPKYEIASVAGSRGEQLDLAIRLLREYLANPVEGDAPAEALAHMQLGFALAKQGATVEAMAELKTAVEEDSSLDAAKAEIKRLNAFRR
jgi:tetratricopeptide (TPR) repeat protein